LRVEGLELRVRVEDLGSRVEGLGFRVCSDLCLNLDSLPRLYAFVNSYIT
jgi:hypothetical protein